MDKYQEYDSFLGYCLIEWCKDTKGYNNIIITNIDPNRTTDLLFLKIAGLQNALFDECVFLKMNWFKYWKLKRKTHTDIPRLRRKHNANTLIYDCNKLTFFDRPIAAANTSLDVIEKVYNAYYKEFENG